MNDLLKLSYEFHKKLLQFKNGELEWCDLSKIHGDYLTEYYTQLLAEKTWLRLNEISHLDFYKQGSYYETHVKKSYKPLKGIIE